MKLGQFVVEVDQQPVHDTGTRAHRPTDRSA